MAEKKKKKNLFSGGLLAQAATEVAPLEPEGGQEPLNLSSLSFTNDQEDDPLFGNTRRIREVAQKVTAITDASAYPRVALEQLENNPYQPRRRMNQKRLEALAHEIRTYGFKGVLLARPHPHDNQRYQLVYGHRRREAAKQAGLTDLPVLIDPTINEDEMKFLAINENVLRDDLTPLDEAYAYASMLEEMSQDAVAARLGVSRGYIRNRIDILKAPEDVQDMVEEKPDTMKAVVYLKDVQEDDIRKMAIEALVNEEITINQMKPFIENVRKAKEAAPSREIATPVASASLYNRQESQTLQQDRQREELGSEKAQQTFLETTKRESSHATLLQQSREQTEALTDKTKIETFTRYLQKYEQRLHRRQITDEEKAALGQLTTVIGNILKTHI